MRAVLGIDAAWTATQPSGVALAVERATGWELRAVAPSYQRFHASADPALPSEIRPSGSVPVAFDLLSSAQALAGGPVDLVAFDMPLSRAPIKARRFCDNEVSRRYGANKCGTHSPSEKRPGLISDALRAGFEQAGYPLQTMTLATPGIIEVYPHPALVVLSGAKHRLPYKAGKTKSYWPTLDREERRAQLDRQWSEIIALLDREISGVSAALPLLPPTDRGAALLRGHARRSNLRVDRDLRA